VSFQYWEHGSVTSLGWGVPKDRHSAYFLSASKVRTRALFESKWNTASSNRKTKVGKDAAPSSGTGSRHKSLASPTADRNSASSDGWITFHADHQMPRKELDVPVWPYSVCKYTRFDWWWRNQSQMLEKAHLAAGSPRGLCAPNHGQLKCQNQTDIKDGKRGHSALPAHQSD
jgi:hypothetical protein